MLIGQALTRQKQLLQTRKFDLSPAEHAVGKDSLHLLAGFAIVGDA